MSLTGVTDSTLTAAQCPLTGVTHRCHSQESLTGVTDSTLTAAQCPLTGISPRGSRAVGKLVSVSKYVSDKFVNH